MMADADDTEPSNATSGLPAGIICHRASWSSDSSIAQLSFSPNGGALIATAPDGGVSLWSTENPTGAAPLVALFRGAKSVSLSPAGDTVAFIGPDRVVTLVDIPTRAAEAGGGDCVCIAFRSDGLLLSGHVNGDVCLWNAPIIRYRGIRRYTIHDRTAITALAAYANIFAAGDKLGGVTFFDSQAETTIRAAAHHTGAVAAMAFSPTGMVLATGGDDRAVKLWNTVEGTPMFTLEGHSAPIRDLFYTSGGAFLVSCDTQNVVRIWQASSGAPLVAVNLATQVYMPAPLSPTLSAGIVSDDPDSATDSDRPRAQPQIAGHHSHNFLAVAVGEGTTIDRWVLDAGELATSQPDTGVTYSSAKIVLVGEPSVGKTGLGWRLAHGAFREHASTHGQQFWTLQQLRSPASDNHTCEAVLWDLAGQPDYRLIHALFLDDVDVALLLFDPTSSDDLFAGVDYWLNQLRGARANSDTAGGGPAVILVAARADRGEPRLTEAEIELLCAQRHISSYVVTSAFNGQGVDALEQAIDDAIVWDRTPMTVTDVAFKEIRDFVLTLKEDPSARAVLPLTDLAETMGRAVERNVEPDAIVSAIGHLANHGYVSRMHTSNNELLILTRPELLNNLAASVVLEARRNPKGLGSLEESPLLQGNYAFPELDAMTRAEAEVLLDSAIAMFLDHNLCFRQTDPLSERAYLVFPQLINLRKPRIDSEIVKQYGASYTVSGATENVYASLVVLLGYTNTFVRSNQWHNRAEYVVGEGMFCGFEVDDEREGELDLVVYFGQNVERSVRVLFEGLLESFLRLRDVTVLRYARVMCRNGHEINRAMVRERLEQNDHETYCARCGVLVELAPATVQAEPSAALDASFERNVSAASQRSRFEQALFRLKAYVAQAGLATPECFISYAWGDSAHERWVERELASDLVKAGVAVILVRWENARVGASVPRFVERVSDAGYVLVVGTPLYGEKYKNGTPMGGFVVAAEGDLIGTRMLGSEQSKASVLPVLRKGAPDEAFPPLLSGRVFADVRDDGRYFDGVLQVVLTLFALDASSDLASALRGML